MFNNLNINKVVGKEKVGGEKKYQLFYNAGAAEHYVTELTQGEKDGDDIKPEQNYTKIGEYHSEEELQKAIELLKGPDVFAVFEDRAAGQCYYKPENDLSGNWKGNREGHAQLVTTFATQKEAEAYVEQAQSDLDNPGNDTE